MPKVSIITPLYNGVKTIEETFGSIAEQKYTDWEWILFDDGSSDGTQEAVSKIVSGSKGRIHFYEHEKNKNHGSLMTSSISFSSFISQAIICCIFSRDIISCQYHWLYGCVCILTHMKRNEKNTVIHEMMKCDS